MRHFLLVGLALASQLFCGCYYSHLASGQLKLLWARQPIESALEDPETPERTRALLGLVESVREFGVELGLDVGGQYTSYVDWPDDRIVTTVVRTRPTSVEPIPYWFPLVGHLPYKGYFDQMRAEAEAERLRESEAYDVCVSGVAAYSTLGWLNDPVTSPMLSRGAESLVETLFHELVHATAFVADDVDFNESVAQFIGQEAAIAYFSRGPRNADLGAGNDSSRLEWPDVDRVREAIEDRRKIALTTIVFRDRLAELADEPDFARKRATAEEEARAQLAGLPLRVVDAEKVAERTRLNNACLALRGTYVRDLPRHAEVLGRLDGDLEAMIHRLAQVASGDLTTEDFYRVSSTPTADLDSAGSMADELDHALVHEPAEHL
jgi:predicted aminopeptidase